MTETERTLKRIEKLLAELLDRLPNVKPQEELPESATGEVWSGHRNYTERRLITRGPGGRRKKG